MTSHELMSPDELMGRVCEKIRDLGWAFYFTPETMARASGLGLDGLRFYFLGRGGVLGDVEAPVVHAAFGYFEPTLVEKMWTSAKAILDPRTAGREFMACAAEHGRRTLSGIDGIEAYCAAAGAVNDVADATALALYAGARAEPLVDDAAGRAMQLTAVLRELRGSAHLVALRATGLSTLLAHAIKRPADLAMFGWAPDAVAEITDEHRERLAAAERLTDEILAPAYAVLDKAGQRALVSGIDAIEVALT
jgi:hypothetical protein